jgi:predicted nucleic acid-binding protein
VRVILDSNVWLATLTTNGFCRRLWKKARRDCAVLVLKRFEGISIVTPRGFMELISKI